MANGDRFFGPQGASGQALGGAATPVYIPLDFAPQAIKVYNVTQGAMVCWVKGMAQDTAFGMSGGGGGGGGGNAITIPAEQTLVVNPATGVSAAAVGIPLAYAMGAYQTGAVSSPSTLIPTSATLASGQYKANLSTGVLTFLIADAVTSVTLFTAPNAAAVSGGGGGGGGGGLEASNAIIAGNNGFSIGTALQSAADVLFWEAFR